MSKETCTNCATKICPATANDLDRLCVFCSPLHVRVREFITEFLVGLGLLLITVALLLLSNYLFSTPRVGVGIHPGAVIGIIALFPGIGAVVLLPSSFAILGRIGGVLCVIVGLIMGLMGYIWINQDKELAHVIFLSFYGPTLTLTLFGSYLCVTGNSVKRMSGPNRFKHWLEKGDDLE
ncbi:MAG TPA: hypothetical protein ACFYD0_15120 [Candidatus Wunengus sp. YC65]|uniref:hypothetical protein n=1 Tax=Candidatus Wunengus sp. YC65 TaxID=3367701 RepID=UPI004028E0B5